MDDLLTVIAGLLLFSFLIAFVRSISADRCLKNFSKSLVQLKLDQDEISSGRFEVVSSGLELTYQETKEKAVRSQLLYQNEYSRLTQITRLHSRLSTTEQAKRRRAIERLHHPSLVRRLLRSISSIFKMTRDTIVEIFSLLLGAVPSTTPATRVIAKSSSNVKKLGEEVLRFGGSAFDPLLERLLGEWVIVAVGDGQEPKEFRGILKEYTPQFIEIVDVTLDDGKADLVLPRSRAAVRHRLKA